MQKFKQFMKSRKGLVLTALVLFGSLFIAFRSINGADSNEKIAQQQKLLNTVGALLEQQHYSPQKINDDFSKKILGPAQFSLSNLPKFHFDRTYLTCQFW